MSAKGELLASDNVMGGWQISAEAFSAWARTHLKLRGVERYGAGVQGGTGRHVELCVLDENALWHTISTVRVGP